MIVALLALPLAGALFMLVPPRRYGVRGTGRPAAGADRADRADRYAGTVGVLVSGLTLLVAAFAAATFDHRHPERTAHVIDVSWAAAIGLRFHVGVDGASLPLVVLTALLTFLCLLYLRWADHATPHGRPLVGLVLLLEVGMLGTFVALDLLLFFMFFEAVLIPSYFMIAIGGGPRRRTAAYTFIVSMLLGSGVLLVGLMIIATKGGTLDMVMLARRHGAGMSHATQVAAFLLVGLGFAIMAPLWPLHSWLPGAHTEAPVVGSVLLAGVLLKMGTYGLIRIALPMAPAGARVWAPWLGLLAVVGIVYGALACLAQRDLKRVIAYSSVATMGFALLGIATLTPAGANAALFGGVAHGLIIALLFFLAGAVEARYGTGDLDALDGGALPSHVPRPAWALTFACLAGLGLPGLAGFWGEMLALLSAYRPGPGLSRPAFVTFMAVGGVGALLTVACFLRPLVRLTPRAGAETVTRGGTSAGAGAGTATGTVADTGVASREGGRPVPDVRPHEYVIWVPLIALTLIAGLWPKTLLDLTDGPVRALLGGG
ncbi:MAG TPA: NADH-quinone oxidoreductase subunit M [Streptosporangiaceae bacterium]|nr:NADH-quinone oxidoreductase subunit M [Streptosporangiaceae bacterium]